MKRNYTMKDIKGIENIQDNWTSLDVLAAVVARIAKKEFPENVQDSYVAKNTLKNKKLVNKNEFLGVEEHKIKKKESNHGFGQKRKRSCSSDEEPSELPEEFKNAINVELNGGKDFTGEVKLLAEKTLYAADILDRQSRLLLPLSYMKCHDFLKPDEQVLLQTRVEKNKHSCMELKIIEPSLELGVVKLRIWENKGFKYVLNGTWKEIVKRNGLGVGTEVQLWGFRIDKDLCFALRKLPPKTGTS